MPPLRAPRSLAETFLDPPLVCGSQNTNTLTLSLLRERVSDSVSHHIFLALRLEDVFPDGEPYHDRGKPMTQRLEIRLFEDERSCSSTRRPKIA